MKTRSIPLTAVTALAALLAAGCGSSGAGTTDAGSTDSTPPGSSGTQSASGGLSGTVTVFAAASLQESFTTFEELTGLSAGDGCAGVGAALTAGAVGSSALAMLAALAAIRRRRSGLR